MHSHIYWSLFFDRNNSTTPPPPPYIRIRATGSENWNNFSYNFEALIEIIPSGKRMPLEISAYIIPSDDKSRRLDNWINSYYTQINKMITKNSPSLIGGHLRFTTLLGSEKSYSNLANWSTSPEECHSILLTLNDIIILQNTEFHTEVSRVISKPQFTLGVLRSSSAYRALRRGQLYIDGKRINTLLETRKDFNFSTELHGFEGGTHELKVNFSESDVFEDRIHCLIGVNGTGKTRLLRELIITLEAELHVGNYREITSPRNQTEALSQNKYEGLPYNRFLVFSTANENRYPLFDAKESSFEYRYFNLSNINAEKKEDDENRLTNSLVDLLRDDEAFWVNERGISKTRFDLLEKVLADYINLENLYIPIGIGSTALLKKIETSSDGKKWVKAIDICLSNERYKLEITSIIDRKSNPKFFTKESKSNILREIHLSSGQKIFFRFASTLISSIDFGSVVIIDEPETHLHPNLICDYIGLLYNTLTITKSIALIATHSAYVVREVPTHCAHVLNFINNSKKVDIGHVRLKTMGASIDSISQAVFGDSIIKKYHEKLAEKIARKNFTQDQILQKYSSILSPELLIEIRAAMEKDNQS